MYIPIKKIMPDTLQKDAGLFCACGEGDRGRGGTGARAVQNRVNLHLSYISFRDKPILNLL